MILQKITIASADYSLSFGSECLYVGDNTQGITTNNWHVIFYFL